MTTAVLLARGGPVMLVLMGMSVLALALILLKGVQLLRLRSMPQRFVGVALNEIERGDFVQAAETLEGVAHPVARIMRTGLAASLRAGADPEAIRAEVARTGTSEVRTLESWLRGLSSIAHLSPLLGLLGTVLGMIEAFMTIERAGSTVDPALLSGGIWEALLTTAFGLTIAIPSMGAFYLFEGEVDRVRAAMRDASIQVLVRFNNAPEEDALPRPEAVGQDYGV